MKCESVIADPMPDASRGTLEFAASAACCEEAVRIELTRSEAANLLQSVAGIVPQTASIEWITLCQALRNFLL